MSHTYTHISLTEYRERDREREREREREGDTNMHTLFTTGLINLRIKYKRNIFMPASKSGEIQERKPS